MQDISINYKLRDFYGEYYDGESDWRRLSAIDKVNHIAALCSQYPHKTILEIGSGEGSILKRLSDLQFGDALYSIEISTNAVETIRQRNIKSLVECRLFDGHSIPYEDKKFDLAVLSHVVEHLEYPRRMLYEAGRVATYVFVEVPLEDNRRSKKDFVSDKVGHINFYSPRTIRKLVQTCGFEVLAQTVTNASCRIFRFQYGKRGVIRYLTKQLVLRAMPGLASSLWTYNCSLLCTGGGTPWPPAPTDLEKRRMEPDVS